MTVPSPPTTRNYAPIVDTLDRTIVRKLLSDAASTHPDIARSIDAAVTRHAEAEHKKDIGFGHLFRSVETTLNVTCDCLPGFAQSNLVGQAQKAIEDCIQKIQEGCPASASLETKRSGLETLRKIGLEVCWTDNPIRHAVLQDNDVDEMLPEAMSRIARGLTDTERETLAADGPWIDQLREFTGLAAARGVFPGLSGVVDILEGGDGDDWNC